jgi:hypothetical protein
MDIISGILIGSGLFLIFSSFMLETDGAALTFMYKFIPFSIGLTLLVIAAYQLGWVMRV